MILSLDLGTTGNRAIVFDARLNVISNVYEEFPQIFPKPAWVEHDPDVIWRGVFRLLNKTFQRVSIEKIDAIGITNQRETVLLWDRITGRPIYNAIVWQCRRTTPLCDLLKRKGAENQIHRKTGLFLDPYFSASKIAWVLDNVPGAKQKAKNGNLLAGTVDTWILWKLTNGQIHATDVSNASRTMLLNIHTKRWDDGLCKLFNIPKVILPRVLPSGGFFGLVHNNLFGREIPITAMVGDQQAASFAQGCFDSGVIKNTYGTGLFMLRCTKTKPVFSKHLLTTIAWSLGDIMDTEYAVEGSVFIGGAAVQWLRDGLGLLKKAADSELIAKDVRDSGGVFFVPALVGLGAPYWDARARGSIFGLTRGTTRAHIIRATLESIAYQTRDILDIMNKDTRSRLKKLRVDGGASANDFLMQFQADILGIPVERSKVLETTALGAAALAALGAGLWKDKEYLNKLRKIDRVFRPSMSRARVDRLYSRWKEAVSRTRNWAQD